MLTQALNRVIAVETAKPKPGQLPGVITGQSTTGRYAVSSASGRKSYAVRGPAGYNRGSNVSYGGGTGFQSITSLPGEAIQPTIIEIQGTPLS